MHTRSEKNLGFTLTFGFLFWVPFLVPKTRAEDTENAPNFDPEIGVKN